MSSVLNRLSAAAKAHHESVNAAYETYYSGGVRPSMEQSRSASTSSTSSTASMNKAWKGIKKAAKEHNDSVNAAYLTYYTGGASPRSSYERQSSVESIDAEDIAKAPSTSNSGAKKVWQSVKRHAKEHHESVNAAYSAYYSGGKKWESE